MATFLEVKQLLAKVLGAEEVTEESNISIPMPTYSNRGNSLILSNQLLKQAFNSMESSFSFEKLEMYNSQYREVAIQSTYMSMRIEQIIPVNDLENKVTYSIEPASTEYCLYLLALIADGIKNNDRTMMIDLRHRVQLALRRELSQEVPSNPIRILPDLLRVYTLRVCTQNSTTLKKLRSFAASYEFHFMYRQGYWLSEHPSIQDMFSIGGSRINLGFQRKDVDTPPQRIYNTAVLEYYAMGMESKDPFTVYISFYHVIEHYFDAIFRKKLTEKMRSKITHPDFSYNIESNLYDLAKYINKHMHSDNDSGKGNEFESMKYVIAEYVPITELITRMNTIDATAREYYQNTFVPFTSSTKTKIGWTDTQGVITNIATRIYETRNALVHSKSEQAENQYRPYKDKKDLIREIALIRAVAELVIINSSEVM